jgi:hypothetical protein
MRRALEVAMAFSLATLAAAFGTGCGDASMPGFSDTAPHGSDPGGGKDPPPSSTADGNGTPIGAPTATDSTGTPLPGDPVGNVSLRVANLSSSNADVCVSPDGGATWIGPLMHGIAGRLLAPNTVSERTILANAHFLVRPVAGNLCSQLTGPDTKVSDVPGDWPATIVIGARSGVPQVALLPDEPSISNTASFVRLVHAADWTDDAADLGTDLGNGVFNDVFHDTPFLGIARVGALSKQGYAALDPMSKATITLRTTTMQDTRATALFSTGPGQKLTIFSVGDDSKTSLLVCNDAADSAIDYLTPCQIL